VKAPSELYGLFTEQPESLIQFLDGLFRNEGSGLQNLLYFLILSGFAQLVKYGSCAFGSLSHVAKHLHK